MYLRPALSWSGLPEGTREISLVCDDPDGPRPAPCALGPLGALKIPAERTGLPEGGTKQPSKAEMILVGQASADSRPRPTLPIGYAVHHYRFKVYALGAGLEVAAGLTKEQLLERMEGHLLEEDELVGAYERK
jgi:phosphatidylethanolamine-binding protein (PEBP) family uncharacterized protein